MKRLLYLGIIALLLVTACNNKPLENPLAKFQPGDIVKLKLTGETVLVLDTPRRNACGCGTDEQYMITFNHANYHAKEIELEEK